MIVPGDGTCRGMDAAKVLRLVTGPNARSGGPWTLEELAETLQRSVRYVHSIVDECPGLEVSDTRGRLVRDFRVKAK